MVKTDKSIELYNYTKANYSEIGLWYGISNKTEQPEPEILRIVNLAAKENSNNTDNNYFSENDINEATKQIVKEILFTRSMSL